MSAILTQAEVKRLLRLMEESKSMNHDEYQKQDEMYNGQPPLREASVDDVHVIESLFASRDKALAEKEYADKELAEYAEIFRDRAHRIDAILQGRSQDTGVRRQESEASIEIPSPTIPAPAKQAAWWLTSPIMRVLFFILIGVGIGTLGQYILTMPSARPALVRPATESLTNFVARESQVLSASERQKLITVTEKILTGHFDKPEFLREEYYYQRLKAGLIDSPAFNTFWGVFQERIQESGDRSQEGSIEFTREVYRELLNGLQLTEYRSGFSTAAPPGEPVEGFKDSPSNVTSVSTSEDVPVSPDSSDELSVESDESETLTTDNSPLTTTTRQRIFRRAR